MQQEPQPSSIPFGDGESTLPPGRFARMARAVAARFGRASAEPPEAPFHDSDFEVEPSLFGRPLGEH